MFQDEQFRLKVGLAEMLKGGVIMDVVNADQDRKSTRLNSSHLRTSRMPSSA